LSRLRVYVLKPLMSEDIEGLISRALLLPDRGLGHLGLEMQPEDISTLAELADGDARRALTFLEIAADLAEDGIISSSLIAEVASGGVMRRFDKGGDAFYDQISALHKSVRGSNPDGALYWFCRMIDGGCDPMYIARRIVRMASEDIGNADPRALQISLDAWQTQERLGSPEGELALAQAIVYLSIAAKSNAVYKAYNQAMASAKSSGSLDVPLHLKNAPTRLMKELDYGKSYRYAHDEPGGYAAGEKYLPDSLADTQFYHPVERGLEIKIKEKLDNLRQLDKKA
jgi:putative ATPase